MQIFTPLCVRLARVTRPRHGNSTAPLCDRPKQDLSPSQTSGTLLYPRCEPVLPKGTSLPPDKALRLARMHARAGLPLLSQPRFPLNLCGCRKPVLLLRHAPLDNFSTRSGAAGMCLSGADPGQRRLQARVSNKAGACACRALATEGQVDAVCGARHLILYAGRSIWKGWWKGTRCSCAREARLD